MLLKIDKNSKISINDQVFAQIVDFIEQGVLKPGERLPSTRQLAKHNGVNRSTILRVYEELWAQGYVESNPGSYTFVRKRQPIQIPEGETANVLRESNVFYHDHLGLPYDHMMEYLEHGKIKELGKINFLQLSPDTRLLNKKHVNDCIRNVMNDPDHNPFNVAHPRGFPPLRMEITKHAKLHNIFADDRQLLITNGSLQSLQLIFQVFSKPGDTIVLESPTYSVVLMFVKIFKLKVIEVPMTSEGMDLNRLKSTLHQNDVRFVYTMPTYQNPTGYSMPQSKREEFLNICASKNCMIIEDSIEEEMKYTGVTYLPLKSIDTKNQVIYLGSFTKILAPGLRMGWIIGSYECIKKLTVVKSVFEISSSSLNQMFMHQFLKQGAFELHLRKSLREFRQRMKVAITAIKKYLPSEKIEWVEPHGGYMIWLKLLTIPLKQIEAHMEAHGILVHNGKYFFYQTPINDYIRICIAQTNETEIVEGIRRLGTAIEELPHT